MEMGRPSVSSRIHEVFGFELSGGICGPFAPHALALLRPRHERPRRGAPQPSDECPSFHRITSSAVANSVSGIVRPSALAVLRLMVSSNFVG